MADLDLRPLSLGEILDRTFTLYRRNFILFIGIAAIPQLLILAFNLAQTMLTDVPVPPVRPPADRLPFVAASGLNWLAFGIVGALIGFVVYIVVYLLSQGGTTYAVSELYLGHTTTIGASLRRMRGQIGNLFGVTILNGLAVMGAAILLVIPGIYVACRLLTCVPSALLEDLGPRASLERSFRLTKDYAGRSFVIYLLYFCLVYAAAMLFSFPFMVAVGLSAKNPGMMRTWLSLGHIGDFVANVLVTPFLTIATAVFYYDLRVRKEAFDLQIMMDPGGTITSGPPGVPTMFS